MKKLTNFIVEKRYLILILFIILTIISIFLSQKVNINYDIIKYLDKNSETKIGYEIMNDEFSDSLESSLNIMFKDLTDKEVKNIYDELENIYGVDSVLHDDTEEYNKDNYTLYTLNVSDSDDSKIAKQVYDEVEEKYEDYDIVTSGSIAVKNSPVMPSWIMIVAITSAMIILIIMCKSYIEPFLFLFVIGLAVFLNSGTNIIFDSVSNITSSITAILQMALSMDYSIMLMNRYVQEKQNKNNNIEAMKEALYKSFSSITSSSITTIVGLLALVFMSFTIGKDLGFVLAKGVFFSLVSIFFVLPSLILIFDKAIEKTSKKEIKFNLKWLGNFSYKFRKVLPILFLLIFVGSYILKGSLTILYTSSEDDDISKIFKEDNQMVIVYDNKYEDAIAQYCRNLEGNNDIKEVLCYGNTINEELTYDKLNSKLSSMSKDINIDEYLLKLIYYNYYNKNSVKLTFNELIEFIQKDVYNNEIIGNKLNNNFKNNINRLTFFTNKEKILKERDLNELSEILDIDSSKLEDILIYYNSKNNNSKISLSEFINFLNSDVINNEKYSNNIDKEMKENINKIALFTDKNTITKNINSSKMSKLFGIDKNLVDKLYTFYISKNNIDTKLSINEFSNYILNDIMNNNDYKDMIDENMKQNITMMNTFSNIDVINNQLTIDELSKLFNIDNNRIKQLLFMKYSNYDNGTKISISQFINNLYNIKTNTNYLDDVNIDSLLSLYMFSSNKDNINITEVDKQTLNSIFNNIIPGLVDKVYTSLDLDEDELLSPKELIDLTLNNLSDLESSDKDNLTLLQFIINDSIVENKQMLNAQDMATLLKLDNNTIFNLYALIDLYNDNTISWVSSPYELVNMIINNIDRKEIASNIDENSLNMIYTLKNIMDSSINNIKYNYSELSSFLNINEDTIKMIYSLYKTNNNEIYISPYELVKFIINNKNNTLLVNNLNKNNINELTTIKDIMEGIVSDKQYSSNEISKLVNVDVNQINLLYSLYDSNNNNINKQISIKNLINFIVSDVMEQVQYKDNFDNNTKDKLQTLNGIVNASINDYKYSEEELYSIISTLVDNMNINQIELLYSYYGSANKYDNTWTLTIEKFVNYLNDNILNDKRFKDFINNNMRNTIKSSKKTIDKSKNMLIGDKYSRIVLNTKLNKEDDKVFNFIKQIKNDINKITDKAYLVGDSPMAYEMDKSFASELDFITVLTMLLIFIVVAITFKSLIAPAILVLIIQCAVYITMGILSLLGGEAYFISILIVQSILMGATIDYAILYTSYYRESRKTLDIKNALINSYNKSIHTILTSASILVIVTLIVGCFASNIAAKICITISQGTFFSAVLIIFILPSIIALFDRFICKKNK